MCAAHRLRVVAAAAAVLVLTGMSIEEGAVKDWRGNDKEPERKQQGNGRGKVRGRVVQ